MGAFHIIGVDFELWLGIDGSCFAHAEVLVRQFGSHAIAVRMNVYTAIEGDLGRFAGDVVQRLVTGCVWRGMFQGEMLIEMAVRGDHRGTM